ncbi:MAG: sulfatase [Bacillota bacterium]|nr:sulfatase [Bacillota bacterium]
MAEMAQQAKTSIIWVFGDQHRAQALSCSGDVNVNTPHIDLLAGQGLHFTQATCGFPLCCPFRGSLLTGLYPHQCVPGHEYPLDPNQPTIAHVFKDAGYKTAYFGKWHLDGFHESEGRAALHTVPPARRGGFDTWLGYENNNSQWDCRVHGNTGSGETRFRLPGYETDELTSLLIQYLMEREDDGDPFFTVLSVQPPHDPYVAPADWMGRHHPAEIRLRPNVPAVKAVDAIARRDLAGYYAQIENLDWNLGRLQQVLETTGLINRTRIIFFSDHGDMHGSHGQFRKTTPYEEAIRIPFIISQKVRYYEARKSGAVSALLNHIDIAPTTLGLCGITQPGWMTGTNYAHYAWQNQTEPNEPDSAYIQSVIPTGHANSVDKPWRGIITKDGWKYVCFTGIAWLMFNLVEDPFEQVNLAHNPQYHAERKRLNDRLQSWIDETKDAFILPENP